MARRTVHLAVYDTLGAAAGRPVTTMGAVRIVPDLALDDLRPEDSALLILPGGGLWDTGDELAPFARKARAFLEAGVPVAAICGAVAGAARAGQPEVLDAWVRLFGSSDASAFPVLMEAGAR